MRVRSGVDNEGCRSAAAGSVPCQ